MFEYDLAGFDHGDRLERQHDDNLGTFKRFLANANADLKNIRDRLPGKIASEIERRREEVRAKQASSATKRP